MDVNKIREVIDIYRKGFEQKKISKKRSSRNSRPSSKEERLAHIHEMLDEIEIFLEEERIEKAFRWLGFIQGCLWSTGFYTIEELKNHNRP